METDERWKRPKLDRTQPIRNWSTMFGPAPGAESNGGGDDSATRADPVSRAVELGYRVIDEYIRQGQSAARRFTGAGSGEEDLRSGWQDAATRMAQLTGEWMGLWINLAQRAAGTGMGADVAAAMMQATPPPADPPAGGAADNGESPAPAARVRLEVISAQPTDVALDLRPDRLGASLVVYALRAVDEKLPRIADVSFTPASDERPAVLHIGIPAQQPAGTYSAVIVDAETNRPAGTVCVRLAGATGI